MQLHWRQFIGLVCLAALPAVALPRVARAAEVDLLFEPGVFTQAFPAANDVLVDAVLALLQHLPDPGQRHP